MIKVYYSYLSDFSEAELKSFCRFLPEEKTEKLQRLKNQKARNESILAWYLLYKALSEKGIDEYSIGFGENGKPFLKAESLYFNLSHSDGFVCCALGEREVGLDAEKIKPVKESLINKVLAENERKTLKEKDGDFIRFWTLKESFLKYSGSGITPEIYGLDFSEFSEEEDFEINSLFYTVKKTDGYYVSVCSEEKEVIFIRVKP